VLARPRLLRNEDDLGYLLRTLRNTFLNKKRSESRRLRPDALPEQLDLVADTHARDPEAHSRPASSTRRSPRFPMTSGTFSWRST
jgi:DNA-directed RNA polymerase specialized sigma24 family protein